MKPYNEGEMEGRRGRSNANRFNAGSRRSTGTTARTPQRSEDVDIDRYPSSWQQHQQTTQQRSAGNNITRMRSATTALDTADASSFVGGANQSVVAPAQVTAGYNNFIPDDDTYASLTSSQDQARWNDMVLPDSISPAGATPTSHLGYDDEYYYNKKKHDKIEEEKAEEQAVWEGMLVHPDTAVSSTTVTGTSSGNPTNNNNKKEANGQNKTGEQAEETQQNDSRSDNARAATTDSPPPPVTSTAGAFAVSADETVQRGGEDDTFTQVSEVGTTIQHDEENSASTTNQNREDGSPVVVQAHLVAHDDSQYVERIQQLEAMVQQQQQQLQQPMAPLVHAEIASAAPMESHDNNHDEMPPPSPPVDEQEQQMVERSDKGAMQSWVVKNRRNRCIAVGLVAVVVIAVVIAVAIPLSNSSSGSSSSSNKGVASNNNTSSPSTSPPPSSEETSVAPTAADTKAPVATSPPTANPTETPTRLPTSAPTSPPPTQLPSLDPTITMSPTGRPWLTVGQELGGKARHDHFGVSISLSRDARVLAVGATQRFAASNPPGHVSIFESDDSTGSWVAKGQELVGEANGDEFGHSVALNGDGTVLAVGAIYNDGGGYWAGHVRVFQHDNSANRWVQLGSDIDGAAGDFFGYSVSLSKAGDVLAAGAWRSNYFRGSVQAFQYDRDAESWEQLGQTLVGQAVRDWFGDSVSLSSSGEILAVGAIDNDSGGTDAGQVSMYQYNSVSSEWDPMGSPINGQIVDGEFGSSVSLDDDGLVVAVGAPAYNDARALVYSYDSATAAWTQRGQSLESQQVDKNFGSSVSLSGNGNVLAVGSWCHDANGFECSGQVTIFQYNTNTMEWDAVGEQLNGISAGDTFGDAVSLSENGTVVAVGASHRDFNGNENAGSASVYTLN